MTPDTEILYTLVGDLQGTPANSKLLLELDVCEGKKAALISISKPCTLLLTTSEWAFVYITEPQ